jgi:hypothetical protein
MAVTKVTRWCLLFLFGLFLPFAGAQAHYSTTAGTPYTTDNTAGCTVGKRNCWSLITAAGPQLTAVSATADGTIYGLDSNQNVWNLPYATRTWQTTALSPMVEIAAAKANKLYGLQADAAYCGAPELRGFLYSGGANFVAQNFCALHVGAAADGSLYRIRSSGNVTHLVGSTWVADPSAGGNGTPVKVAVGSSLNVWILTSTGALKVLNSSGTFVLAPGWASDIAVSGLDNAWIIGHTVSGANLYEWDSSTATWTAMAGVMSKLTSGSPSLTLALPAAPSTYVYHFQPLQIHIPAQTTGYYDCSNFGVSGTCPNGSSHTAYVYATFSKCGNNVTGSFTGTPPTSLFASVDAMTQDCDPIFGDPSAPECKVQITGRVICSIMGALFSAVVNTVGTLPGLDEYAQTTGRYTGTKFNCITKPLTGIRLCLYSVQNWCTAATTPPDFDLSGGFVKDIDGLTAPLFWEAHAACFRLNTSMPWECTDLVPFIDVNPALRTQGINLPLATCTHNP